MQGPVKKVIWETPVPSKTNLCIYAVRSPRYDPVRLKTLADFLNVRGAPSRMPPSLDIAPGYWIKYPEPDNSLRWQSVFFSERTGALGYGSPDDGYRWDFKNHKPLVRGIPTHAEALQRTLALLPTLGLTTNDLELNSDGSIRRQFTKEVTWYNERDTNERREMVQKRSVLVFQRIPTGETLSVGDGGALEVAFVSEGKIAEIRLLFRDLKSVGTAKQMSVKQLTGSL